MFAPWRVNSPALPTIAFIEMLRERAVHPDLRCRELRTLSDGQRKMRASVARYEPSAAWVFRVVLVLSASSSQFNTLLAQLYPWFLASICLISVPPRL